jgi:hypothetical protein
MLMLLLPAAGETQVGYPPPLPSPYGYRFAEPESNLRLVVTPREAMVYVDGYLAGAVDEFDGMFQRLHVTPGEHELVLYLPGYRTARQSLYLSPNATRKITQSLEKLGPGDTTEPPPVPAEPANGADPRTSRRDRSPFPGQRGGYPPPREPREPDTPPRPRAPVGAVTSGSLVLLVQPVGAEVVIDGERRQGPSSDERLVVPVSEGRHRVEVRKDGYLPFSNDVEVAAGASVLVNVTLVRQ